MPLFLSSLLQGTYQGSQGAQGLRDTEEVERERRNKYLNLYVDIINVVRWNGLTEQQKNDLTSYHQALLDVPQQPGFPAIIN